LLGADASHQILDLLGNEVVDPDSDAVAAGCRYQLGGLLDRLGRAYSEARSRVVRPVT
jgi:hypothetical protein